MKNPYNSFAHLLFAKAKSYPDSTAFLFHDKPYSWKLIDRMSKNLAIELKNIGVNRGDHVAICSENSINWIVTFFAIQYLEAISVHVNNFAPINALKNFIELADVDYVCLSDSYGFVDFNNVANTLISETRVKAVYDIGSKADFLNLNNNIDELLNIDFSEQNPKDVSFMIFTTGSEGIPKIVCHSINNIILYDKKDLLSDHRLDDKDINLASVPMFHVFCFWSIFGLAVICGAPTFIPDSLNPVNLLKMIDRYKITFFVSVAVLAIEMINNPVFKSLDMSSVKKIYFGGANTNHEHVEIISNAFPNLEISCAYGMSEVPAISCNCHGDPYEWACYTSGRSAPGTNIKIVDFKTKESLGNFDVGEIYIKSNSCAVGYYKDHKIISFLDDDGWFHTGDFGYIDDNTNITVLGRVGDMIIKKGENIYPEEVEMKILEFDGVKEVKVFGIPNEECGQELVCALKVNDKTTFNIDDLIDYLHVNLLKFKVPSRFKIYDQFPIVNNTKIDIKQLTKDFSE